MQTLERKQYKQSEITQRIKDIFTYFDNYRDNYEEDAIDWYKAFVGYKEDKNIPDGKSNLHIPKTYEIVDTIRARILSSFFDQRPYIEFTTMPEAADPRSFAVNEDKAKVAASFVDEQLEKNNVNSVFYDFVTSMLIFPSAFLGVGWRYEKKTVKRKTQVPIYDQQTGSYTGQWGWDIVESEEIIWDDNEIFNIDFFDFWGDPDATNIDDSRAVFHREFTTIKDVKEQLQLLEAVGDGIVYPVDWDKIPDYSAKEDEGVYRRLSAIGISNTDADPFKNHKDKEFSDKEEVELLHYWEDDRHTILLNRDTVIYDGANPYWRHMKKPFIKATYDQLPNEFYGMSAVQIIYDMQEEVNTMHNQRMDNVSLLINRMWKKLRGTDVDEKDLISRAGGVVEVDNMDDIMPIDMPDIPQSAFVSEEKLGMDIQRALGTPANVRGAQSERDQSATEASITAQAAQTRFGTKIKLFETVGLKRMAMMMDLNNQQFICNRRAARIDPEDRNNWQAIEPNDLVGEFDYSPATSSAEAAANKDLRREQLTEIIGFLMQAQVPFINYKKLIEEWLSEFDIKNPEKFMIPEQQYEIIRRQLLEQMTPQEGVPVQDNDIYSTKQESKTMASMTGNLGKSQMSSPQRRSGGMSANGTPQPQPGQRGGGRY